MRKLFVIVGALVVLGVIGGAFGGILYVLYPVQVSTIAGLTRNYFTSWSAPPGATTTELNREYKTPLAAAPSPPAVAPSPSAAAADWPSYNRTLASERHSELNQINTNNVGKLGGVITYTANGAQKIAVTTGLISPAWPVQIANARILILGLEGGAGNQ
jgi:alcohol dehydrogenase (cytochrome c)